MCAIIVMDTHHFVLVQTMYTTMSEPKVNSGFGVIDICQYRLISCYKCPTRMWGVDNGGGCTWPGGQEGHGKISTFLLNVAVNLKVL